VLVSTSCIAFYKATVTYYKMGKQLPNKADKFTNFSWWPADLARPLVFFFPCCMSTS